MARMQINASQNGYGAVTNRLVVTPDRRRFAWNRGKFGSGQPKGLSPRFFVDTHRINRGWTQVVNRSFGREGDAR